MKKTITALLAALMLASCANNAGLPPNTGSDNMDAQNNTTVDTPLLKQFIPDISQMSVEEKVGQLFLVRCSETEMDDILSKKPAGILMFGVDFKELDKKQVQDKIRSYQKRSSIPLIIAVDEEGGTVVRVSSNTALSDEKYKSPQSYYNEGGIELVTEKEEEKCEMLAELGINMNLAPVADVSTTPSDFIYDRSLGQNAEITAQYVAAVVEEMKDEDIASCMKHFPGYGSNADTHTGIAVDERPMRTFERSDFLPFLAGAEAGADAVLVSHNIVNCMDDTQPASISPAVHEILRDKIGFEGLAITDDMSMEAVADYGEPYIKAVNAGNNLVIVSDFASAYDEVLTAVRDGRISENTLNAAVERTLKWKKNL